MYQYTTVPHCPVALLPRPVIQSIHSGTTTPVRRRQSIVLLCVVQSPSIKSKICGPSLSRNCTRNQKQVVELASRRIGNTSAEAVYYFPLLRGTATSTTPTRVLVLVPPKKQKLFNIFYHNKFCGIIYR